MKKILVLTYAVFTSIYATAQDSTVQLLHMLNAPSNPAFNLMGISTSAIERPTDLTAFKLSIQNATNNFTKLPNNYAIEISPAALFNIKGQTLDNFDKPKKYSDLWWQTLSLSLGVTRSDEEDKETDDASSFTKLGFGLKFSFVRPKWTDTTKYHYEKMLELQKGELAEYKKIKALYEAEEKKLQGELVAINSSVNIDSADKQKRISEIISQLQIIAEKVQGKALDSMKKTSLIELKEVAQKFKIERKGPFLDFASGLVLDFPDNRFNYSLVGKAGAWLTGGYEGGNNFSFLGIARYLYQPDKIFADDSGTLSSKNISTFDIGAKIAVNGMQGKFAFSTEYIRRSVITKNVIDPSWRLVFNTEYDVGNNQKLTLAIGRNFDGTITKDGNIIAALNFVKGFGSNKKINSTKSPN